MSDFTRLLLGIAFVLVSMCCRGADPAKSDSDSGLTRELPAISTAGFGSGIQHWRKVRDENRMIQATPDQASYAPTQVREIVANLLLFQRDNGGWPKDYDMLAVLNEEQRQTVRATRSRADTSFDNDNVHSQVVYLAQAYTASGETAWREACLRGLDFMLAAQLSNGGFPQRYPNPKGFSAHITFNDGVMMGIMNTLKDCSDGVPHWQWLDAGRKEKAAAAVNRGVECILKCQIRFEGKPTGWCQQHDAQTWEAASARTFELASICPQETTQIVRFLMRLDSPSAETRQAIASAMDWLQLVALHGTKVERVPAPREEFLRHTTDFDLVVSSDPQAPTIWARHYEIGTNRPIFAGRDGVKRYALSEVERERRTGTAWYGAWPQRLIDQEYPAWKKTHAL